MFACLGVVFVPHVCNLEPNSEFQQVSSLFHNQRQKEITQFTRMLGQSEPFHALPDTAGLHIMAEITGLPHFAPPPPQTESHSQSWT